MRACLEIVDLYRRGMKYIDNLAPSADSANARAVPLSINELNNYYSEPYYSPELDEVRDGAIKHAISCELAKPDQAGFQLTKS